MSTVFRSERVRAAKPHRCYFCLEPILRDEVHQVRAGETDGDFWMLRAHIECDEATRDWTQDDYDSFEEGTMERPNPYPEHKKLQAVKDKSKAIGEFLDWGQHHGYVKLPKHNLQEILAVYFAINQNVLDKEKEAMLAEIRRAYEAGDGKAPCAKSDDGQPGHSAKQSSPRPGHRG